MSHRAPGQGKLPAHDQLTDAQLETIHAAVAGEMIIGGMAGTGKTIAAVHRAAQLCLNTPRRNNEATVLFLCFNRLLAVTVQQLVAEFPSAISSRIEVRNIHRWCWPYLRHHHRDWEVIATDGQRLSLIEAAVRQAKYSDGDHPVYKRELPAFLKEIEYIKGCGFVDVEEYLDWKRGSGTSMDNDELRRIFAVAAVYDDLQRAERRLDFDDFAGLVLQARTQQRRPKQYDHVIVDEAQDLSTAQLELIRGLARNSLLIIADQQQAIYSERQRLGTLPPPTDYNQQLNENFRCTAQIFGSAQKLASTTSRAQPPTRSGPNVTFERFRYTEDEASFIGSTISDLLRVGVAAERIAVLAALHDVAQPIRSAFHEQGLPSADTRDRRGRSDGVHVSTIYQGKGREFDVVFVPGLTEGVLPRLMPEMERSAQAAEVARGRRLLYVAMTRARHQLYVTSADGPPSRYLYELGFWSPQAGTA